MKTCKIHGELSPENIKSGVYRGKKYSKCRLCENERSRVYTKKIYADPELVAKKHARDKARWQTKKAEITAKWQTPEARAKRKAQYKEYAPRYRESCNQKQQQYRENLGDHYVKKLIQNGNKDIKFNLIPPALVELKRSVIQLKRAIKMKKVAGANNEK